MQNKTDKWKKIYPVGFCLIFIITGINLWLIVDQQQFGKIPPLLLLLLFTIYYALSKKDYASELSNFLDRSSKLDTSSQLLFLFLPGLRLLSSDLQKAQKGPTGQLVTANAFWLLILILTSMAQISASELLIKFGWIPVDWYKLPVSSISFSIGNWLTEYAGTSILYVIYCGLINFLVEKAFVSGYKIKTTEYLMNLSEYFGIINGGEPTKLHYWSKFSEHLSNIYGHKTWAGPNILQMVKQIEENKMRLGTSQWFLLEFAAEVLDYHVQIKDGPVISFTYDDSYKYSSFLERTMDYSSKSIIWIVDKKDFSKYLLPTMIQEVIFSMADDDSIIKNDLKNLKDKTAAVTGGCELTSNYCTICSQFDKTTCSKSHTNCTVKFQTANEWRSVLAVYYKHAIKYVEDTWDGTIPDKRTLWDSVDERETDRFFFPHLRKYYSHPAAKTRIIDLSPLPTNTSSSYTRHHLGNDNFDRIITRLFIASDLQNHESYSVNDMITAIAKLYVKTDNDLLNRVVLSLAFSLFGHICNSKTNHKVIGFAEISDIVGESIKNLSDIESYDIGVYDGNVLVHSNSDTSDEKRYVRWVMGHPIIKDLSEFDPLELNGNNPKCIEGKKVYEMGTFVEELETKVTSMATQ